MYNPTLPYGGLSYNFAQSPMSQAQPAQTPVPNPQQFQQDEGIKRVHGREGATMLANSLGPNKSALAVDETEVDVIWCMVTDGGGFPTLKKLRFTVDDDDPKPVAVEEPKHTARTAKASPKYVTKKQFDELKSKIEKLEESLNDKSDSEHARATKRTTKE